MTPGEIWRYTDPTVDKVFSSQESHNVASSNFRWSGQSLTSFSRWSSLCEYTAPMLHMRSSLGICRDPHTGTLRGTGPDLRYGTVEKVNQCQWCCCNKSNVAEMLCRFGVTNGPTCQSTILELRCWMTANMAIQSTGTPWHCHCEVPCCLYTTIKQRNHANLNNSCI